jgi:hypothetical protein
MKNKKGKKEKMKELKKKMENLLIISSDEARRHEPIFRRSELVLQLFVGFNGFIDEQGCNLDVEGE